jgi:hypothetical protein
VAQVVERLLCKHKGLNSKPSSTKKERNGKLEIRSSEVEHLPSMYEALGSIPITGKKRKKKKKERKRVGKIIQMENFPPCFQMLC